MIISRTYPDLSGRKFCKLTVIRRVENHITAGGYSKAQYLCRCDCGNEVVVLADSLQSGNTKACGCYNVEMHRTLNRTHGQSRTRLYRCWQDMKHRCYLQSNVRYKNYGGRGISVCEEWKSSYENFSSWAIENGYKDNLTLDRIDVDGNYEPSNCRWVTNLEQMRNRTNSRLLTLDGTTMTVSAWAEKLGVSYSAISNRLQRGWSVEKTLTCPVKVR